MKDTMAQKLPTLEEMTDILDIESIILSPLEKILIVALMALALIGLVVFLYYFIRWFKNRKVTKKEIFIPPDQRVYQALMELESREYIEKGEVQKYFYSLSDIYRYYLEDRYQYPAIDKTTHEILSDLGHDFDLDPSLADVARTILKNTDNVKFAKAFKTKDQAHEEKTRIIHFVEKAEKIEKEKAKLHVEVGE